MANETEERRVSVNLRLREGLIERVMAATSIRMKATAIEAFLEQSVARLEETRR